MSVVHSLTFMLYITVFIGYGNCEVSYTRQPDESGIHVKVTREKLTTLPDDLEKALAKEGINKMFIHKLVLWGTSTEYILDRAFTSFEGLTEMEITCGRFSHISQCAFADSKIETVKVAGCSLKPFPTTCNHENLKALDLINNQIKYIESHTFSSYVSLDELFLTGNKITSIEPEAFLGTKLSWLSFRKNKLKCIPDLGAITSTLYALDMSYNYIHQCEIKIPNSTFPQLSIIDLTNNRLSKLPSICYLSPKLSTLYINNNYFVTLEDFRDIAPALYQVKFDRNPLVCDCRVAWLKGVDGLREVGTVQCSKSGPNPGQYWRQLDKSHLGNSCPTSPLITKVDNPLKLVHNSGDYTDRQITQMSTIATTYSTATGQQII